MNTIWYYCKYCIGTGECPKHVTLCLCPKCNGLGIVKHATWLSQKHTLGGGERFKYGFGPVAPFEASNRLQTKLKYRLLFSLKALITHYKPKENKHARR